MTPYDKTLARAEEKGILFYNHKSKETPAMGAKLGKKLAVSIDESAFESDRERRAAVVHEVNHCETGSLYNEHTPEWVTARIERRVTKATAMELVSFDKIFDTYKQGIISEYEQAEEWDIPLHFVKVVHEAYEEVYPDKVNELKLYVAENFNHYA